MERGAVLSKCGLYRYRLWRTWDADLAPLIFVMLNPSTADAEQDDATIRKCIGFAARNGFGGIVAVNLFAYRATEPSDLKAAGYLIGPENDDHIAEVVATPGATIICAWGSNARGMQRVHDVLAIIALWAGKPPMALKLSADGVPWHPLMPSYDREFVLLPPQP